VHRDRFLSQTLMWKMKPHANDGNLRLWDMIVLINEHCDNLKLVAV
jgi:hypothetical protein